MISVFSDEYYMKQAYQEAQQALEADEIPIGAVVVCNNKIIARAHNQTETLNDVTAHAEMLAITAAANAWNPAPCAPEPYATPISARSYGLPTTQKTDSLVSATCCIPRRKPTLA